MSFSRVYTAQTFLLKGQIISVETDITKNSLHNFTIVGLPDKSIEESKDRVSSALKNSGFDNPKSSNQKIVVSLTPADIKKEGSYFDLAIALGFLLSSEKISFDPKDKIFLGELALNGEILPIKGTLALVKKAQSEGYKEIYVPEQNAKEGALVQDILVYGVKNLKEVIEHLDNKKESGNVKIIPKEKTDIIYKIEKQELGFEDIKGQEQAKRGLLIAASGRHNIILHGPPGTGKTMLARVFCNLLPELKEDEVIETTTIHSIIGANEDILITKPPFRSPHHTSSYVSVIGGGVYPKPGEVTLAHNGVLFLDEFPEFEKRVIESLREPLEDNKVSIARAKGSATFPSNFILIAAMNPCPCGYRGAKNKECVCKPSDLDRYKRKLSGPILDRIDLSVEVSEVNYEKLSEKNNSEINTIDLKQKVKKAIEKQNKRFTSYGRKISRNSEMNAKDIEYFINLKEDVRQILNQSAEKLSLSGRAYHRVIKLARTIADLEDKDEIETNHILEAIQYRPRF